MYNNRRRPHPETEEEEDAPLPPKRRARNESPPPPRQQYVPEQVRERRNFTASSGGGPFRLPLAGGRGGGHGGRNGHVVADEDEERRARHFHHRTFLHQRAALMRAHELFASGQIAQGRAAVATMLICPACETLVPRADSTSVRIGLCGHVWHKNPAACWDTAVANAAPGARPLCAACQHPMT